ncbi:ABC transporter permease [Kitasatospora purpeofusca]|uniref:ABC transporter permease n=1 Tax=Kitasatospora purpeofusca TaxID=67352 RepID=UPI0033CC7C48
MSFPALPLTWHLLRRSGRRGLQGQLLAVGAATVSAVVMLILLAAWLGAGARADRTGWRTPASDPNGTAVQALSTTFVRGEPATVVNLAQLPGRAATAPPPGLSSFPEPGEVYLSPALADLARKLPTKELAERFPTAKSHRTIGDAGLAAPDELLAVVGRAPSDAAVSAEAGERILDNGLTSRAVVSGFTGTKNAPATAQDQNTVLLGAGLLAMPVVVLASAAGRLGAARREERLAALRLAGATPRQVLAMTGAEATAVGALGATTGALAYGALLPGLARLPFGIGSWFTGDLWVGIPGLLAVVAVVAVLTGFSAVSALRRVVRSPLGVAQQSDPRRTRMVRLALFVGLVLFVALTARSGDLSTTQHVALIALFYAAFWIVGPWVVDRLGRLLARLARRPSTLLAARRLSDDPNGAWRTVSGLVMAGLVAGFFSVAHLSANLAGPSGQVAVTMPAEANIPQAQDRARALLEAAGVDATVQTSAQGHESLLMGESGITADIRGGAAQIDAAVTALTPLNPAQPPYSHGDFTSNERIATTEIRYLGVATMAMGFVIAATSAGLTAAANVLDRRRIYTRLRLAGTPLKVLDRARLLETALPLVTLAGGTTASGVYLATKLNNATGTTVDTTGALQLGVCVAVGVAVMSAAIGASRRLLRTTTADPLRQEA